MMRDDEMRTEMQDKPVCPHCGNIERDAWEIDFGPGLDGDTLHTCGECGEEYEVYREVIVYYSTKVKP